MPNRFKYDSIGYGNMILIFKQYLNNNLKINSLNLIGKD